MDTRNFLLGIFALSLLSCMEDVTTVYEQNVIETVSLDPPSNEPNEAATEVDPAMVYSWISGLQSSNGLVASTEFTNFVSLYDNALAALTYMAEGDIDRAERILDFFNERLQSEFHANNGGFFQYRDVTGEQGSRIWMGDNAWLLLALNHYHEITQTNRYETMAGDLDTWLRSLQEADGGLKGGINEDGSAIPRVTEGIITAFNAVQGFDEFHERILLFLGEQRWDTTEGVLITDSENPVYQHALDLYTLGYLILPGYSEGILYKADRFLTTQHATAQKSVISGYCFDDDRDVVWLEGTAQMAMAFKAADLSNDAGEILLDLEEAFIQSEIQADAIGLPYTTNLGTNFGATELWGHADKTPTVSSTAWYLMVKKGFDPFQPGREKSIPSALKFWSQTGTH